MENQPERFVHRLQKRFSDVSRESLAHLGNVQKGNLRTFKTQPLQEISGALGDLGTLLPLLIALASARGPPIDLGSTLVFTGLANIATGFFFGIPLPVQPMKAIAATALSNSFRREEVASAGLLVAAVIGVLSITGLIEWFNRKIPVPVIKGIQMGVGLSLVIYAGSLLSPKAHPGSLHIFLAALGFLGLLLSSTSSRLPLALLLLLVGILSSLPNLIDHPTGLNIWKPHPFAPSIRNFGNRAIDAAVGQIPLTALNSIIAVTALSTDLLPKRPRPTTTSIGLSVAAMNLVSCWFGCMPVCHGSGGLAAQYRFGARSGASIIFLGLIKLTLGLFAGQLASHFFREFPEAILGIMVVAAGLELVNVGESLNKAGAGDTRGFLGQETVTTSVNALGGKRQQDFTDQERRRRWATMFMTTGAILAFKNDAVGFLAGMLCHWTFQLQDWLETRQAQREGGIRLENEDGQDTRTLVP